MEAIARSDIFFFITSLSVIIFTLILVIAGFYLIRILKNVSDVSDTIKETVDDTNEQLATMRERIKRNPFLRFIFRRIKNRKVGEHKAKS